LQGFATKVSAKIEANAFKKMSASVVKDTMDYVVNIVSKVCSLTLLSAFISEFGEFVNVLTKEIILISGKCMIPCLHKGRCKGINKCRCRPGYSGNDNIAVTSIW